jgi:hypothetical protein
MIALIAALLLGTQPLSVHPHRIERGAVTRYGAECAGKQTPACQVLRREAEAVLLYDFLILEQGGVKLDPAMLRNVAANAVTPVSVLPRSRGSSGRVSARRTSRWFSLR